MVKIIERKREVVTERFLDKSSQKTPTAYGERSTPQTLRINYGYVNKPYLVNGYNHIFFTQISSESMAGLAQKSMKKSCVVSGSDIKKTISTVALEKTGATISYKKEKQNIKSNVTLVVIPSMQDFYCPEVIQAQQYGIPIITRTVYLKELHNYEFES